MIQTPSVAPPLRDPDVIVVPKEVHKYNAGVLAAKGALILASRLLHHRGPSVADSRLADLRVFAEGHDAIHASKSYVAIYVPVASDRANASIKISHDKPSADRVN